MIHCKVEIITVSGTREKLMDQINNFLATIDVRQILKIEYQFVDGARSCMVTYVNLEDLRQLKIDKLVDNELSI